MSSFIKFLTSEDGPVVVITWVLVGLAAACSVGFVYSVATGDCADCARLEAEAVQHNAATWTVDADGERVFVWNESEVRDAD